MYALINCACSNTNPEIVSLSLEPVKGKDDACFLKVAVEDPIETLIRPNPNMGRTLRKVGAFQEPEGLTLLRRIVEPLGGYV